MLEPHERKPDLIDSLAPYLAIVFVAAAIALFIKSCMGA